ncbi:unnamed protein product [Schistosoma mattheei]|uniref:Uncharacterized protein n=1 Tax=Schistosoma mattheei TaxID=31246 RepID=A0A183NPP0_9TREM|nr:unnamed protein product [Schistosoma mattheei]
MLVGGSQQETLNLGFVLLGTCQKGVPVILWGLMLSDEFHPVSQNVTNVTFSSQNIVFLHILKKNSKKNV